MRIKACIACAAILFGGVVPQAPAASAPNSKKRMNFVWMFPDTLRAESHSSYGFPLPTTPNLDKFAAKGVRFEQTHVAHTQCSPSRVTMLTGRHMHVLGHRTQTNLIQPYEFNYFQILKDSGYNVQYYGKNDAFSEDSLNLSVSEWHDDIGMATGPSAVPYPEAGYYAMLKEPADVAKDDTDRNGEYRAVTKAVTWMKSSPPEPFLVFIPGKGAHPPYGSPREFHNKFSVDMLKEKGVTLRPPYGDGKPKYHSRDTGIPHYRNFTSLDDDFFYRIQSAYLGMVSYSDWIFGELLKGIEEAGLEDNTAIFYTSDHGDFAGDFHLIEKWPGGADDVLTRVPLFARVPGGSQGFVAQAPVSLIDVPHTICELAGLDVRGDGFGPYGRNFGTSLLPQLLRGEEDSQAMSRFVYAEGGFSPSDVFPMGSDHVSDNPKELYYPRAMEEMSEGGNGSPRWIMMRNLTHKLVYRSAGGSELYSYAEDPRELRNLFADQAYRGLRDELQAQLMQWLVNTSDVSPVHQDPRGLPNYPNSASACATSGAVGPLVSPSIGLGLEEEEEAMVV